MKKIIPLMMIFSLAACGSERSEPAYLTGDRIAQNDPSYDNAEGRALIAAFNEDNGKIYCVPNLNERELVEFKASIPALMVQNIFDAIDNPQVIKDVTERPLQNGLRTALVTKYPCK